MQCNTMFEMLEPRRLFPRIRSTALSVIADADGRPIFTTPAGKVYVLPYVNSKGSLIVTGSDNADRLPSSKSPASRPSDADGDQASGVFQELLQKPPAPFSAVESYIVAAGNMKVGKLPGDYSSAVKLRWRMRRQVCKNLQNSATKVTKFSR